MVTIKEMTRELRKNSTESEDKLWQFVRGRQIGNVKFIRQYPIRFVYEGNSRFFIADFYCAKYKLVIEVDGKIHDHQKDYDQLRTSIINEKGLSVLRFTNEQIATDISFVVGTIEKILAGPSISLDEREGWPKAGVSL